MGKFSEAQWEKLEERRNRARLWVQFAIEFGITSGNVLPPDFDDADYDTTAMIIAKAIQDGAELFAEAVKNDYTAWEMATNAMDTAREIRDEEKAATIPGEGARL